MVASLLPAPLSRRCDALRRDLQTIARDLTGRRPPPFTARAPLPRHVLDAARGGRWSAPLAAPRALRVARVTREADGAAVLHLEDPTGAPLEFRPGQLLTLGITLPSGERLERAYPVTGGAGIGCVVVAVQRARGGRLSRYLCDELCEGETIEARARRSAARARGSAPSMAA